jgi:hypothetical protein
MEGVYMKHERSGVHLLLGLLLLFSASVGFLYGDKKSGHISMAPIKQEKRTVIAQSALN